MTITIKKKKDGKKFYAQVFVNGQRPGKMFDSYDEAVVWERETKETLKGGGHLIDSMPANDMTFSDASGRFIIESRISVSVGQIKNYEFARRQLLKSFGARAGLSSISPQDVAAHLYRRMSADKVGPSIIRLELSFIRLVYAAAATCGVSIPSPELAIKRPRPTVRGREEALDRVITPIEIAAILTEAAKRKSNLHDFLAFLLYTGMRPSEAAGLYWERLPVKEEKEAMKAGKPVGYVDIPRGGFSKVGTKTEQRFVPAHPVTLELLRTIPRDFIRKLVFLDDNFIGRDRSYLHYRRSMKTTLDNARLEDGSPLRGGIDFYSFRHTARSAMVNCGIPFEVAETIIGHSGHGREVAKIYIHLSDGDLCREIAKLKYY